MRNYITNFNKFTRLNENRDLDSVLDNIRHDRDLSLVFVSDTRCWVSHGVDDVMSAIVDSLSMYPSSICYLISGPENFIIEYSIEFDPRRGSVVVDAQNDSKVEAVIDRDMLVRADRMPADGKSWF